MKYIKGECNCESCRMQRAAPDMHEALKFVANQIVAWTNFRPELKPYTFAATVTIEKALAKVEGKC